jgi:acyl transferase domain-containing protein
MTTARTTESSNRSDIAIVGMSGRFPGAKTIEAFWQNLKDGVESRTVFSDDELRAQGIPSSLLNYPGWVKSGFTLDDIEMFDARFFGLNPREAGVIDPQHRVFLECAWEALEDAGYDSERYDGSVAVFGGSTFSGYLQNNVMKNAKVVKSVGGKQAVYGSVPDYMVTRVSYKLNLKGPCMFVQSACSTSLVAIHLGCQSLHSHEADMVLAGGVSVVVPHRIGYVYEDGGMMSPDGICRTFDVNAKGTVFGSGVGVVVLKRLADAIADGDAIHAVIKGAAVNNDGSLKVGFTAPSVTGQAQVIAEAMASAGVHPESIGYVEAHGTGTELGDPIEISALTRAYRASTDRTGYCAVGSVKPNVGHLDAAAGVSSLIKAVMSLKNRQIAPTINYEHPNPKIDFENSPFFVNTVLRPWPANGTPRRAGVSSFGFGGTNAHFILEEAPELEPSGPSRGQQLLLLSAKTETALDAATGRLAEFLIDHRQVNLADVAHTLTVGRRMFKHRRAVVCGNVAEAIDVLQGGDPRRVFTGEAADQERSVVFMFPGQGSQYVNMGLDLYREEPVFREVVDECSDQLQSHLGFDLRSVLFPPDGPSEAAAERLKQTAVTQSALFVIELAMARLWMSWGVVPAAMIGHSIGEFVAACVAGVLRQEDALRLVALRGRLMGEMQPGTMLAVPLPEIELQGLLGDPVWLAAVNAPSLCVVSGESAAIDALAERLRQQGVESRPLRTSHAFHSGMMDGAVAALVEAAKGVEIREPQIPYISNVTGTWITESQLRNPEYWGRHIRGCVRFAEGVAELLKNANRVFVEIGPGSALSMLARQQMQDRSAMFTLPTMRQAQEQISDVAAAIGALGRLWLGGASPDYWPLFYANQRRHRVGLPPYPFERSRHWVDAEIQTRAWATRLIAMMSQPEFADWFHVPTWKRSRALPAAPAAVATEARTCLVFTDEGGVGTRMAETVARLGYRTIIVEPGSSFAKVGEGRYTIAPSVGADYLSLMRDLQAHDDVPVAIAHLWMLTRLGERRAVAPGAYEARGFYSLIHLAQAIGELGVTTPMRIGVFTEGVLEVTGRESLVPEKATVLGPSRVIPQEFSNIGCRQIDVEISPELTGDQQIAGLVAELFAPNPEPMAAYRAGRRWVRTFEPVRFDPVADGAPSRLRAGGVYLITGGMGGVGLVLAEYLAREMKAKLVLTGRSGLPPRAQWAEIMAARGPQDGTSRKIQAVEALEAAGAEVIVGSADVTDEPAMQAVVDQAYARFGRIDGVIHAAGVAGGGMIQLKTPEIADAVLAPKVTGTQVLERVLAGRPLDFLMLCSSLTGVLGGVGQVDYCGANAYLDAFATHYTATTGTFTVSVNWNAWREVGMAVDTEVPAALRDTLKGAMLASGVTNTEGVDAFRRILSHATERQVALSPFDVQLAIDREGLADDDADIAQEGATGEGAAARSKAHARPNLQTAYVAPSTEIERKLCALWQDALGLDAVGVDDNFFDLGGHSLLAVQVMGSTNKALNTSVPVAKLYEGLTVAFLAGVIGQGSEPAPADQDDADLAEKRREKSRRQKEHQQRRRVALGR